MLLSFAVIIVGFAMLIGGANLLVEGASGLAARIGMPDRVVGLTIVAIGTGMPELVVSITSAANGYADMAFGNVAGSCMANLLLILGLAAVIMPLGLSRRTQRFEIPVAVASVLLLLFFANTEGRLVAWEGAVLIAAFVAFVANTVYVGLHEGEDGQGGESGSVAAAEEAAEKPTVSPVLSVGLIVAGIALLKVGADFVVDNSVFVATELGVSERIIGITVVALGTCLPELVTSSVAAFKGNSDIAVGNVVGSNITNVLLVMGVPALFTPVVYDAGYNFDFVLLVIFSITLVGFAFIGTRHTMTRRDGTVFVMLYVIYIVASTLR